MKIINKSTAQIAVSIILILCLFKMPYGYYQFVRVFSLAGFSYLAYLYYKEKDNILIFIYIGFALLFQPFAKIIIDKQAWQYIDFAVASFLIISIFIKRKI